MDEFKLNPIGIIHSEFKDKIDVPIQPKFSKAKARVEVYTEYIKGLKNLGGFSHIILIYYFHKSKGFKLKVRPYLDETERGLFSTRAPNRPNNIGISTVKLEEIKDNILFVYGVDILDKSPLLDIKPYIKEFKDDENIKSGWINGKVTKNHRADDRF